MLSTVLLYFLTFNKLTALDWMSDKNSYGPFSTTCTKFEACEDDSLDGKEGRPVRSQMSECLVNYDQDISTINLTVFKACDLSKSVTKSTVIFIKNKVKQKAFTYNIHDICSHFALGPLIKKQLNLKNDCIVPVGNYIYKVNFTEATQAVAGSTFFYGDYEYKSTVRCGGRVLCCIESAQRIEKRKH